MDLAYIVIVLTISFISIYLSIFWISLLYLEEDKVKAKPKELKYFPFISIIIPAHNEEQGISKTLESVLGLNYPRDRYEAIVVANACTDKTVENVKKFEDSRIKLVEIETPGKGHALNVGLKHAKGDFIGCMDADSFVDADILNHMIPNFDSPKVGAVISGIKVNNPKSFLEKLQWFEYIFVTFTRRLLASLNALHVTPGAISIYRKDIIKDLGGFDENTITEDLEIAMRLQYNGYDIKSQISGFAYTNVPDSFLKLHRQRVRWYRGWLNTVVKYKKMVFNRKYGFLGMIQIPVTIIIPLLLMFTTLFAVYSFFRSTFDFLNMFYVLKSNILRLLFEFSFRDAILGIDIILFPLLFIFICGVYLLHKSHYFLKERWKHPFVIMVYFTIYQFFLSAYWLIAASYEMFGVKKKW